jgi:N-acetylmuramoyl-L-alanine amidase
MINTGYSNIKKTALIIDAGHGGIDPTTGEYTTPANIGKKTNHKGYEFHNAGWFYEGVSNRIWAQMFAEKAIKQGYQVAQIYHQYKDTSLSDRIKIENELFRLYEGNTLLLSFHSNAMAIGVNPQSGVRGFTLHTFNKTGNAYKIASTIAPAINEAYTLYGSRRNTENLCYQTIVDITAKTLSPAILIENLFFDNTQDAIILNSYSVQQSITDIMIKEIVKIIP